MQKIYPEKNEYRLEGDFTIDYWIYDETETDNNTWRAHITTANSYGLWLGLNQSNKYVVRAYLAQDIIEVNRPPKNEWTHIAICRNVKWKKSVIH